MPAAVLLDESFDYGNGALVTVSAGNWTTHSGTAGEMEVISGRADLRVPASEDVNRLLIGQPFTPSSAVTLYASFTVKFTGLPSLSGTYFAHFKGSGTSNYKAKVFAFSSGAGPGQYRLGLAATANSPAVTNSTLLSTNVDYRVYISYNLTNLAARLWVNPNEEASAAIVDNDPSTVSPALIAFALRQDAGIGVIALDDLKVGTSFAEVYSGTNLIAPFITQQPVGTSAIEGGAATFVAAAVGTAPLSFQWNFNGNPILGATNTTLALVGLTTNAIGAYSVTVTNVAGATNSVAAPLTVIPPNANGTLSLVHYNVKGNFASDWSTNAPQVQAIARQLRYLNPDLITLNEIPNSLKYEMTNWMTAFFPDYQFAISPGTDGVLRSGVISRYPFTRTQSYFENASLTNFGYNGTFTRDLFEAEITVPGATEPLHVFTTHLKSAEDTDSQQRRAAECSMISNYFSTVFRVTNGTRPYVLTGDLNEDVNLPMSLNLQTIQRLVTPATGLQLTTPLNPFTLTRFTHSIQGSLDARFDYVLPAGVLASNLLTSQVFRTDLLPPPLPLNLNSNDDIMASDHLPVVMVFQYPDPPLRARITVSNQTATLAWPALVGRKFAVQASTNLTSWFSVASNLVATTTQPTWVSSAPNGTFYYRVIRTP